uniref:NADH:ubiquinone oxidoreductase intermediate-associated protein 30 domain-containing protein n=1 Tax=Rhodosorus marinus TaxID=101924 RepID=A0A7S3ELL3_9RHOD|mmetsp:Transcript_4621/g.19804  ORF Transcript_4621/g.19804 Transcript_4621/m.19804 type:complete len:308 (+) Transcript_4621:292-1215(+)
MAFVGIRGGVLRSRRVSVRCCAGGVGKKSVLVVGATGKLGRLVVEELLQRKMSVIGLARDRDRAKEVGLGEDLEGLDMRFGTFADGSAVEAVEAVKEDVGAVIWAAGPSRTSPSAIVDNQAVNEVAGKFKDLLAGQNDYLFDFENSPSAQSFRPVDDVVMGGVSRSIIESTSEGNEQYARFQGNVSFENNGGFCAIRNDFSPPIDLSKWTGIVLQVRGDGKRYKMSIKIDEEMEFNYQAKFTTSARSTGDPWETIRIPFSRFTPMKRGKESSSESFTYHPRCRMTETFVVGFQDDFSSVALKEERST